MGGFVKGHLGQSFQGLVHARVGSTEMLPQSKQRYERALAALSGLSENVCEYRDEKVHVQHGDDLFVAVKWHGFHCPEDSGRIVLHPPFIAGVRGEGHTGKDLRGKAEKGADAV
jgi:hypothetical protein